MTFDELKEKAHALPLKPGVYIMQDKHNVVIYVGKAKALKNRVSQYFADLASHTEKTRAMVSQIDHFDVIVADSEFEALVLESSLIKRHQPHYNILLKDDKGYPYIRLTVNEDYPRFSLANKAADDGARYFGPYKGATAVREVHEETGILGEVVESIATIDYWFTGTNQRVHKLVHHFALRRISGELTVEGDPDHEAEDAIWVDFDDLDDVLSYPNERKIAWLYAKKRNRQE